MNLKQKFDLFRALSVYPAITVMVFLRYKIGFRMINPLWFIILTLISFAITFGFPLMAQPHGSLIILFALAMSGLAGWQYWNRWAELRKGKLWHSYSPGISYIEALPFPAFMQFGRRINRFIEPPLVILCGLFIGALLCHALGIWIMFSGFFLFIYEQHLFERSLAQDLDMMDGLINSKAQAETSEFFLKNPEGNPRSLDQNEGIPTGLAPDIHRQVTLRLAKQNPTAPDNLAL